MELVRDESARALKEKKAPFYILHGQTEFLQNESADTIVDFLVGSEDKDSALVKLDCGNADDIDSILDAFSQPSLFSPLRIVLVRNAQNMTLESRETTTSKKKTPEKEKYRNHQQWERFHRLIQSPLPDAHTVFVANAELKEKPSGTTFLERAYAEINRKGFIIRFPRMYEEETVKWLVQRAHGRNLKLSHEQGELMLMRGGSDLRHLANEIEKLALYAEEKKHVDDSAILELVTNCEGNIYFDLVDAMFAGKKNEILNLLRQSLESDTHPLQIVATIASNLRLVWQARCLLKKGYFKNLPSSYKKGAYGYILSELRQIPKSDLEPISEDPRQSITAKVPFVVYKYLTHARRLSPRILERWLLYCSRTDLSLKGISKDGTPEDIVLDKLIAAMMREIRN